MSAGAGSAIIGEHARLGLAEAGMLLSAARARRARRMRDRSGCRESTLRVLRGAGAALGGPVLDCEPNMQTRGGFFSCIAVTAAGRCFAKGVLTRSREVRFWAAWRQGFVRAEGTHYRLVPPVAIVRGRLISVLVFPELRMLEPVRRRRIRLYERNVAGIVRAIADFNSDHLLDDAGPFPTWHDAAGVPVPGRGRVERALGVDARRAGEIVRALRRVEAGWEPVRRELDGAPHCLGHMDVGRGNIVLHQGRGLLIDFAHAGAAPVGADLHTVLRYAGASGASPDDLIDAYAAVFAEKGIPLDRAAARRSLDVHFAARYRDLRLASARDRATFEAALATAQALIERDGLG